MRHTRIPEKYSHFYYDVEYVIEAPKDGKYNYQILKEGYEEFLELEKELN